MNDIPPGRYRHYKGNEYSVVGIARHSETLEEMIVYRPEYGERGLWVRPRSMFLETVLVDGKPTPRFQHLGEQTSYATVLPGESGQWEGGDESCKNLFDNVPEHLPTELVQTILTAASCRIERIISQGHSSPEGFWYDQDQHEWVVLLQGAARLRFENEELIAMKPGDYIHIAAHRRHRVDWTTPNEATIWLALHYTQ